MHTRTVVLLSLIAAGCSTKSETDTAARLPRDSMPVAAPAAQPPVATKLTVNEHGIGVLRAGMTMSDANTALGGALSLATPADSLACTYANWKGAPEGVHLMFEGGRLARVEVRSGSMETADGARIGDTEEKVKGLYSGRIAVQPSKYSSGHYLVVTPSAPTDSAYRIIFETEKNAVTKYRAGMRPQVEYVEGCG